MEGARRKKRDLDLLHAEGLVTESGYAKRVKQLQDEVSSIFAAEPGAASAITLSTSQSASCALSVHSGTGAALQLSASLGGADRARSKTQKLPKSNAKVKSLQGPAWQAMTSLGSFPGFTRSVAVNGTPTAAEWAKPLLGSLACTFLGCTFTTDSMQGLGSHKRSCTFSTSEAAADFSGPSRIDEIYSPRSTEQFDPESFSKVPQDARNSGFVSHLRDKVARLLGQEGAERVIWIYPDHLDNPSPPSEDYVLDADVFISVLGEYRANGYGYPSGFHEFMDARSEVTVAEEVVNGDESWSILRLKSGLWRDDRYVVDGEQEESDDESDGGWEEADEPDEKLDGRKSNTAGGAKSRKSYSNMFKAKMLDLVKHAPAGTKLETIAARKGIDASLLVRWRKNSTAIYAAAADALMSKRKRSRSGGRRAAWPEMEKILIADIRALRCVLMRCTATQVT